MQAGVRPSHREIALIPIANEIFGIVLWNGLVLLFVAVYIYAIVLNSVTGWGLDE